MRFDKQSSALAAGFVALFAFGVASAQPAAPSGGAGQPATAPAEIGTEREVSLTPQQMDAEARKYLPEMERGQAGVKHMLDQARQARDVVKVLCLTDKLNQMDVAIRSTRDRIAPLKTAAERNDVDRAKHEFTVMQVLRDRVKQLVAEANQCIGEETGFVGESRLTVEIDPNLPPVDPSEYPPDQLESPPPVLSSPTL